MVPFEGQIRSSRAVFAIKKRKIKLVRQAHPVHEKEY